MFGAKLFSAKVTQKSKTKTQKSLQLKQTSWHHVSRFNIHRLSHLEGSMVKLWSVMICHNLSWFVMICLATLFTHTFSMCASVCVFAVIANISFCVKETKYCSMLVGTGWTSVRVCPPAVTWSSVSPSSSSPLPPPHSLSLPPPWSRVRFGWQSLRMDCVCWTTPWWGLCRANVFQLKNSKPPGGDCTGCKWTDVMDSLSCPNKNNVK